MVGLYHKRRASRSSSSKLLRFFIRLSFILGTFIIIGFTLTALFFNGSQVKGPLSIYLSSKFNMEVTIEDAEFSPIYPDVIKLYNIKFGKSNIGELYLEYDLRSVLSNEELKIKDLYLNKINIEPDDLLTLAKSKLGFNTIRAQTVRFYGTPLRTIFLKSPSSTVRLEQVSYSSQDGLTFRSGALSTGVAYLFGDEVKSFNIEFAHNNKGIAINNFSAAILGGTVTGYGTYNIISNDDKSVDHLQDHHGSSAFNAEIALDELNLSKVIINQGLRAPKNVKLSASKTNLTDVIFTNDALDAHTKEITNTDSPNIFAKPNNNSSNKTSATSKEGKSESQYLSYIMQGINGSIDDLYIDHNNIEGIFDGHIDEISFPNLQTTFENNNVIASFENNKLEFDLKGNLYEGKFNSIGSLDLNKKRLSITKLVMNKNKLALNPPRLDFIQQQFSDHSLFIKNAKFKQLEFLSFINSIPLSIQSISGTANNIFVHPTTIKDLQIAISEDKEKHELNSIHQNNNKIDGFYKLLSYLTLDEEAIAESKKESLSISKHKLLINPDIYSENQDNRAVIKDKTPTSLKLNLVNMLYSNLLMSDTNININLDEIGLAIDIPKMRFKESSLNAQAYLAFNPKLPSKLTIQAKDFETADLNSNLIDHMLTGKADFDLNIESTCKDKINNLNSLVKHSNGNIKLSSPAMLIADFGLDLINGGNSANYKLSGEELLSAIQGSVAGINNLQANTKITNGLFNIASTASLVTSNISLNSKIDLNNNTVTGRSYLISRSQDSSTQVNISGTLNEPIFNIKALRRGEKRPGMYLPQYHNTSLAKEQTDAAYVLKSKLSSLKTSSNKELLVKEETIASKQDSAVPKEDIEANKQDNALPKEELDTSKQDSAVPKEDIEASKQDNALPKEELDTSKQDNALPKEDIEASKQDNALPKEELDTSKKDNALPKEELDTSKKDSAVPKEDIEASKQDNALPKEELDTSKQDSALPKKELDTHKQDNFNKLSQESSLSTLNKNNEKEKFDDAKHSQAMLDEEHQSLNRQKQLEAEANETELDLLKDVLIDSILSNPNISDDEEELIF